MLISKVVAALVNIVCKKNEVRPVFECVLIGPNEAVASDTYALVRVKYSNPDSHNYPSHTNGVSYTPAEDFEPFLMHSSQVKVLAKAIPSLRKYPSILQETLGAVAYQSGDTTVVYNSDGERPTPAMSTKDNLQWPEGIKPDDFFLTEGTQSYFKVKLLKKLIDTFYAADPDMKVVVTMQNHKQISMLGETKGGEEVAGMLLNVKRMED